MVSGIIFFFVGLCLIFNDILPAIFQFNHPNWKLIYMQYVGSSFIFVGSTLYFVGRHTIRLEYKTAAENEEIDLIVNEFKCAQNKITKDDDTKADNDSNEVDELIILRRKPSEVSVSKLTFLRKRLIDLCDNEESLITHGEAGLADYEYYLGGKYDENYERYSREIASLKVKIEKNSFENEDKQRLKEIIKDLRESIAEERMLSSKGEGILESITHWSLPAAISLLLAGILPLLQEPYFKSNLIIINWMVLGSAGAIIYTADHMRGSDTTKVGEDEGNVVLRKMLLSMLVGLVAALLLYVAIWGGVIEGIIFPQLGFSDSEITQSPYVINALSVFWGIMSGYSVKLFNRLVSVSDQSMQT